MTTKRKFGGQPGNRNALKHALYARHYSEETKDFLRKWDVKDYIGEAHLIRVSMDTIAELLLSEDVPAMEKVAMVNALSRASRTVTALVSRHLILNTGDDPIYIAWDDITHEHEFFTDGAPPE
ncbi:MAG: hypothetical protein WC901_08200 [Candidatus Margulisiibacteriota bacterium]